MLKNVFRNSLATLIVFLMMDANAQIWVPNDGVPRTNANQPFVNPGDYGYNPYNNPIPNGTRYGTSYSNEAYQAQQRAIEEGRKQCHQHVSTIQHNECEKKVRGVFDATIDGCNTGAIAGGGIAFVAGAVGGTILAGTPVLGFTGPIGWVVIGVGAAAAGYSVHQTTACRDHAGRDLESNLKFCATESIKVASQRCYYSAH